jgi:hypothetical protein
MPLCENTGTPLIALDAFFHFRSSVISGSASRISSRMRASVSPRQSPADLAFGFALPLVFGFALLLAFGLDATAYSPG